MQQFPHRPDALLIALELVGIALAFAVAALVALAFTATPAG
jgi:hypothetical protein